MSVKLEKVVEPWFNGQFLGYNIKWSPSMMEVWVLSMCVAFVTGYLVKTFHRPIFKAWVYIKTNLIPRFLVSFGETVIIGIGTFCTPFLFCGQYAAQWWEGKMAEWAAEVDRQRQPPSAGGSTPSPPPISSSATGGWFASKKE